MKQNKKQKLALDTQTVRTLSPLTTDKLDQAAGGSWPTKINSQCGTYQTTICTG